MKRMSLPAAIKTGKKIKRIGDTDWRNIKAEGNSLSVDDLLADDYITEDCNLKESLTMVELEAAYAKVNEAPPGIGRAGFREFVEALCGVKIK